MYFALGAGWLLLALVLCVAGLRLARVLAALEDLLLTTNEEIRETLPEVRGSLGNINDISAGVNVAVRAAGSGAGQLSEQVGELAAESSVSLRAGVHGLRVGFRSLIDEGRSRRDRGGADNG